MKEKPIPAMAYFHEAPQEEIDRLVSEGVTWEVVSEKYKQPDWCCYPDALDGSLGCWSLVDVRPHGLRNKISVDFCKSCAMFRPTNK